MLIGVTPGNINARLDMLYKERDRISNMYSRRYDAGIIDNDDLDEKYDHICDIIDELCRKRRSFDSCALEGDPEYGLA